LYVFIYLNLSNFRKVYILLVFYGCLMTKAVVFKDDEAVELINRARARFITEFTGLRATDEAVVLVALKKYVLGDADE
jgi:hypothetical protein